MLPRQYRLRRDRDIRRVLQSRLTRRGRYLLVRGVRRDTGPARLTVVVSSRVSKKATVRNRIKRQVRARLGRHLPHIPAGRDYLVSVLPRAPLPTAGDLTRDIEQIFPPAHRSS
ncbi:MAG: ribonuclease P protein component [Candidatus Kerfeldbacteria bacterium]|nr:ribonuclease P protein component [Candidatus Kerfeldbacteria bacterium]